MERARTEELIGALNATERRFAPSELWVRGDTVLLERHPRVAIVGTRHPSDDGARRAQRLTKELVDAGVIIVSGLAQGIDTIAHTIAIRVGGRTIAVIGTPIDKVFPKSNEDLQRRIGDEHLLVSQFAPGTNTTRASFPMRNRTMALIADASVIVEASEKSGTISQGWEAIRLGRPLFLLKSLVDAGLSWPRELLDHGAFILNETVDLLDVLPTDELREAASF